MTLFYSYFFNEYANILPPNSTPITHFADKVITIIIFAVKNKYQRIQHLLHCWHFLYFLVNYLYLTCFTTYFCVIIVLD